MLKSTESHLQPTSTSDPPMPITQEASVDHVVNTPPVAVTTSLPTQTYNNTINTNSTNLNSTISSIDSDAINSVCTLLHHQDHTHYILTRFCQPVPSSVDPLDPPLCKYGKKGCMVRRSRVYKDGKPVFELSPTVFIPLPGNLRIYKYNIIDTRTYTCCQPSCTNTKTKSSKLMHHACFMHAMKLSSDDPEMTFIAMEKQDDKILEYIRVNSIERKVLNHLYSKDTPILFPVCGKRCSKLVTGYRHKEVIVLDDNATDVPMAPANWEKDSNGGKNLSSIQVLIDWLTTEENASQYFGGVNEQGKTNAMRKEGYHKVIKDLIFEKTGEFQSINI
jgi:hypothetical protein